MITRGGKAAAEPRPREEPAVQTVCGQQAGAGHPHCLAGTQAGLGWLAHVRRLVTLSPGPARVPSPPGTPKAWGQWWGCGAPGPLQGAVAPFPRLAVPLPRAAGPRGAWPGRGPDLDAAPAAPPEPGAMAQPDSCLCRLDPGPTTRPQRLLLGSAPTRQPGALSSELTLSQDDLSHRARRPRSQLRPS